MHRFQIYRCDPDQDAPPRMQTQDFEIDPGDRMLLDVLIKLKGLPAVSRTANAQVIDQTRRA